MKIELSPEKFKQIVKQGYSLDLIFLLKMIEDELDLEEILDTAKLKLLLQTAERKGLIADGKLAAEGKALLAFPSIEGDTKYEKKKAKDGDFLKWWNAYPPTDSFEYRGKKFSGGRGLRLKKEDCKAKINKILIEGEYTIDDLVNALKLEVYQKKEQSYKTGQNKLSYMQASLTYLNQCTYENFIELAKTTKIEEKKEELDGINI